MLICSWLEFVVNWVALVRSAGISNYFVACFDDDLLHALQEQDISSLRIPATLPGEELVWGGNLFKQRVSLSHRHKAESSTVSLTSMISRTHLPKEPCQQSANMILLTAILSCPEICHKGP